MSSQHAVLMFDIRVVHETEPDGIIYTHNDMRAPLLLTRNP